MYQSTVVTGRLRRRQEIMWKRGNATSTQALRLQLWSLSVDFMKFFEFHHHTASMDINNRGAVLCSLRNRCFFFTEPLELAKKLLSNV